MPYFKESLAPVWDGDASKRSKGKKYYIDKSGNIAISIDGIQE
jgi:hypothetical protein